MSRLKQVGDLLSATPLKQLLNKADAFAPEPLRQTLGQQLWELCQPVGFVDSQGHIIMLCVASSCAAMEVSMRKPEILKRLQQLQAFAHIRDLRICVQTPH